MTRRRRKGTTEFSFDSFLDLVANVIGIILRLILIAWVAARGYQALVPPPPALPVLAEPEMPPLPADPRTGELKERERVVEQWETEADEAARRRGPDNEIVRREMQALERARAELWRQHGEVLARQAEKDKAVRAVVLSLEELQKRSRAVQGEVEKLKKLPSPKKKLRYHLPVSAEVQSNEIMFECRGGRVTFIDYAALTKKAELGAREQMTAGLTSPAMLAGTTSAVGPYRMKYEYEKALGAISGGYRATLVLVPIEEKRGETEQVALGKGSKYREVIDYVRPEETAITFWVYADSFSLYRALREELHQRGFVVAGRPLQMEMPIGASWKGTASRGQ